MKNEAMTNSCMSTAQSKRTRYTQLGLEGVSLLLAEDNDLNQQLVNDLLSRTGAILEIVQNGQEAIDILRSRKFDGVLMDLHMPVMDGYEASRIIREQLQLTDLPIIAMTAELEEACKANLIAAGMSDYISKPFKSTDFFNTLSKWFSFESSVLPARQENYNSIAPIKGLDVESGLYICQGKETLYLQLLSRFSELHRGFISDFKKAQAESDFETMSMLAHSLKGVAGNIGAKLVEKTVSELNDVCLAKKDKAQIDNVLGAVEKSLEQVLLSLDDYFSENNHGEENAITTFDEKKLAPFINDLYQRLKDSDTAARISLAEITKQLKNTIYKDRLNEVINRFENYHFEQAIASLKLLATSLDIDLPE